MSHLAILTLWSRKFFIMALLWTAMGAVSGNAPAKAELIYDHEIFETFANELMNGLNDTNMEEIFLISGYGRLSVVIAPIRLQNRGNSLITPEMVNELNAFLLSALMKHSRANIRYLMHEPAGYPNPNLCSFSRSIVKCGSETSYHSVDYERPKADVVVVGNLIINGDRGYLSYKAYSPETGIILAALTPKKLKVNYLKNVQPKERQHSNFVHDNQKLFDPTKHRISQLQRSLKRLGYRPGRNNGYLTPRTRDAIRSYQWHHNLAVTGDFSRTLLKHLYRQIVIQLVN